MNSGFVALYRKIQDNFLWEPGRPRTKAEAWLDIVMEVQHSPEPKSVLLKGRVLHCRRGQSLKALETWAERWGWSKSKVVRFFEVLEKEKMIERKSERVTTRLTVVNYDRYNPLRNGGGASGGRQTDTQSETKSEPQSEQSNSHGLRTCEKERNADDAANGTQTGTQAGHRRQSEQRRQGEQCIVDVDEENALVEKPIVDNAKLLRDAERFSKKLAETFAPQDKRNSASFANLKHDMYEYARQVDADIFLEGISLICKAEENQTIRNRQAWVMRSIRNKMAKGTLREQLRPGERLAEKKLRVL